MAQQIDLRSKYQILGQLIRTWLNETDYSDVAPGSDPAILFEAIASSQAQIELKSLKILENANLESLVGEALDKKAESIRLPNTVGGLGRIPANQANGPIIIGSSFQKVSSKLYAGKPAPYAGSTKLFLEDASGFGASGNLYIGRGTTDRFEGPIPYSAVSDEGSFWEVTLGVPLAKSHLLSDQVTMAQQGDRTVPAGTVVRIPANNQSPAIFFTTKEEIIIPDGEAEGTVNVTCTQFGEIGNAVAGTITEFANAPFPGATVENATSFKSGKSSEDDESLRLRIKNYPSTLSRGTKAAILSAIQGLSDPESGRTIQSANIIDPAEPGDFARVYIDDNTGLEPSYDGQPYELLLNSASGQETQFGLAQFPVAAAVAIGTNTGPFILNSTLTLQVQVDDIVETFFITPSQYVNINSASGYEIARDLNSQTNLVGVRTMENGNKIVISDLSGRAERMKILPGEWQGILGLPVSEIRPIFLYKNSELLSPRGRTATLETRPRNLWTLSPSDLQDIVIEVDGVPVEFSITNADFASYGSDISTATVAQWAEVLRSKVPGVKFTVSGQVIVWSTWQEFSSEGSLSVLEERLDGTPAGWIGESKMWQPIASGGVLSDIGSEKFFKFNRFTGEIELLNKPDPGDKIEIGTRNTRGFVRSIKTTTGQYSLVLSPTLGNSRFVVGFDGNFMNRAVSISAGSQFTPTIPDSVNASNILRLTASNTDVWASAYVGDYLYLIQDQSLVPSWSSDVEGFYRIKAKGNNVYSSVQNFSSLSAEVTETLSVTASVKNSSDLVTVTHTDHGLQTGDLVTVNTAGAIGGISGANLSVIDESIIVLDENRYQYQAAAAATSDANGTIDEIASNVVTVTHSLHPMLTGSVVDITTGSAIGGISSGDLSVTGAVVTVIDQNTWQYRAAAAALSDGTGTLTTISYQPDAWVEIELSSPQITAWTPLLSSPQTINDSMINLFLSSVTPQLIDFGSLVSDVTIDQAVAAINSQITAGSAVKISPQQLELRSNNYNNLNSTVGVLAVVGNAVNLIEKNTGDGIQAHTAFSISQDVQAGAPITSGGDLYAVNFPDPEDGKKTLEYLLIEPEASLTDILDDNDNPTIESSAAVTDYPVGFQQVWLTGRQSGLNGRVYNNQVTAPFQGIMRGDKMIAPLNTSDSEQTNPDTLDRYSNFSLKFRDLPLTDNDRLVIEMDLDSADKTVAVPMHKKAKIQAIDAIAGSGRGQVISFRLLDPEDSDKPFFASDSVYKDFDFTDFKLATKSVGLYREDVSDRALVLRSVSYGAQARLKFSVRYPTAPDEAEAQITHVNGYSSADDVTGVNTMVILTLTSGNLVAGSLLSVGEYKIVSSASGTLYDWRITSGAFNATGEYIADDLLNIGGSGNAAGSYKIISSDYKDFSNPAISVAISDETVTVTQNSHGLQTGDLVTTIAGAPVGGIAAADLSRNDTPIIVIDPNTFTYEANAQATSNDTGNLTQVTCGIVTVKAPGSGGYTSGQVFSAPANPVSAFPLAAITLEDMADTINDYLADNPVMTAEAIGTNFALNPVLDATYISYPASSAYSGTDLSGTYDWHVFSCHYSGSAGIWQYDSSVPSANGIKATVQSPESIFPTTAEASGTTYLPIGEEVVIIPTNTKTLKDWLEFKATSSLNITAHIERVANDYKLQVSSKADGADGAVNVTGVNANQVITPIVGNSTEAGLTLKTSILSSEAKSLVSGQLVKIENQIESEIRRSYRFAPTGSSITPANTVEINTFFRQTNSIKYVRVNSSTGRFIFQRFGMFAGQTEPLATDNTIEFQNEGNGLVRVISAQASGPGGSGKLSARVGDMMYIFRGTPFASDAWCHDPQIGSSGVSSSSTPEYIGYPVVHVVDENEILVIAPNIQTFNTTVLTSSTDLVFLPAIYNEKNIQTNHAAGAQLDKLINDGKMYYLVKTLGAGLVSVVIQNSSDEASDSAELETMSVATDDIAVFGEGFDPANQGSFKIIAHNGRNHLIVYNPGGGKDELIDQNVLENGGKGSRKWRVGPIQTEERPLRIVANESVKIGDLLRISTPGSTATTWFDAPFFGSFKVTNIGYHAFTYSGPLPHTPGTGSIDLTKLCPYVDVEMANAPQAVRDNLGAFVDDFIVGLNDKAIGFVEGTPFSCFRVVSGSGVDPQDIENNEIFLAPKYNSEKISDIFGSVLTAMHKIGFELQINQGIDGYKIYTGLVREAHRTIDGLPSSAIVFPGVKAAGAFIEVLNPLIRTISLSLRVYPKDGVSLNTISDLIKSTVSGYVNNLGVGRPVVLSEIIRIVQGLPGVFSVEILDTAPDAVDGRIVTASSEKAIIINTDEITVS